ncbi:MAG: PQQ-like beta-propeller repeat protein [Candidatus Methylomirabilis sp.]|nr:PQQ-like beta-propeller repeat protein [Candidatus Methylomirabilis sp.]
MFWLSMMTGCGRLGEADVADQPRERWAYTTKAHLFFYGLLAGAPIAREEIRGVLLDRDRCYLAVGAPKLVALDRHRGNVVWERALPYNGGPLGDMFVEVGERLVIGLYDEQTRELVVLGLDRADGTTVWRVNLPGAKGPTLVGDEASLEVGPRGDAVIASIPGPGANEWHRIVLRASDGAKVAEARYPGYVWRRRLGTPQVAGLILGYEGDPSGSGWKAYRKVLAFHESTGQLAWSLPLVPEGASSPTVLEDSLLIANGTQLLRIDLRTGQPRWKVNLGGRIPDNADPPLVVGAKVAVVHRATPDPKDRLWKLGIHQLEDGAQETHVNLVLTEIDVPSDLRGMGNRAITGSSLRVNVVDVQRARLVAALDFRKMFSSFVYADPRSMWIGGSDDQGFVAVTTDGVLRYFAAEDFRDAAGSPGR